MCHEPHKQRQENGGNREPEIQVANGCCWLQPENCKHRPNKDAMSPPPAVGKPAQDERQAAKEENVRQCHKISLPRAVGLLDAGLKTLIDPWGRLVCCGNQHSDQNQAEYQCQQILSSEEVLK